MARYSEQMNVRIIVAFLQDRVAAEVARGRARKKASSQEMQVQQAKLVEGIMSGDLMQIIDAYVAGAELDKPDVVHRDLPINLAIESADSDCFTLMSNFVGFNVNAAGKDGDTALHAAARKGDEDMIRVLVGRGASTWARNDQGQLPEDLASGTCRHSLAKAMVAQYQGLVRFKGLDVFQAQQVPGYKPN